VNALETHKVYEGQVLVLFAIGSIILLAFAALAVDVGLALSERRGAQNAADAATLAVARAMVEGESNQAILRQTAQHYAQVNG
jgi:Flp pilus assembly protein TadG